MTIGGELSVEDIKDARSARLHKWSHLVGAGIAVFVGAGTTVRYVAEGHRLEYVALAMTLAFVGVAYGFSHFITHFVGEASPDEPEAPTT